MIVVYNLGNKKIFLPFFYVMAKRRFNWCWLLDKRISQINYSGAGSPYTFVFYIHIFSPGKKVLSFFKNLKYVSENEERLIICRFFDKLQFEYVNDGTGARIMARHISVFAIFDDYFFSKSIIIPFRQNTLLLQIKILF